MQDRLHLYPTVGKLLWMWVVGIVVQVAWWVVTTQRELARAQQAAQKKSDGDSSSKRAASATATAHTIDSTGHIEVHAEATTGITSPAHITGVPTRRSLLWRKLSKQSLALTLLATLLQTTANTVLLYARTGAWVEQPYEWYSLERTGERMFKATTPLPAQILSTCRFRNVSKAPRGMLTMDDVVAQHTERIRTVLTARTSITETHSARIVVYVVPYSADGVVDLSERHVKPVRDSSSAVSLRTTTDLARARTSVSYEKAAPLDDLTLFPYLWHSMLGAHFDARVASPSPWSRSVESVGLEYRLVRSQREFTALPSDSNVLAVVQWMPSVLQLLASSVLSRNASVGFVALAREDCNNIRSHEYTAAPQLKFGFLPYGDCSLVDGERFAVLPLGPSFEHGFPTNTHRTALPPVTVRKHLLNLMVSWTAEKPTRVQAMMAALAVCESHRSNSVHHTCVVEHNDLAFKALQRVDVVAGTNLRWLLSSAPNAYIETLKQSIFTLCPHGKNPEQYRIWEALAAGSIPIIEEFPQQSLPGTFYHPSYPTSWKCVPEDLHGVLRELRAPVLFVRDWRRDLPRIVDSYLAHVDGMQELLELQRRVRQWYLQLGHHLQASVVAASLRHFKTDNA